MSESVRDDFHVEAIASVASPNLRKTLAFAVGHGSEDQRNAYARLREERPRVDRLFPMEVRGAHDDWSKETF